VCVCRIQSEKCLESSQRCLRGDIGLDPHQRRSPPAVFRCGSWGSFSRDDRHQTAQLNRRIFVLEGPILVATNLYRRALFLSTLPATTNCSYSHSKHTSNALRPSPAGHRSESSPAAIRQSRHWLHLKRIHHTPAKDHGSRGSSPAQWPDPYRLTFVRRPILQVQRA
jgi:hypothetical protein